MTADERGRWYRVYARSIRQHKKFRNMNLLELGAWMALRSEAELRDRASFLDKAEAVLVLRRRGGVKCAAMVDQLIELGLFDVLDDGSVTVHDRADHDRPQYPSDAPDKVAERKRESRARHEGVTNRDGDGHDTHAGVQPQPSSTDSSSAPSTAPGEEWDESVKDGADAYYSVTGRFPTDRVLSWINRLTKLYGDELFSKLLSKCYLEDSNPRDLLGRVEERCKAIYYRQHKSEIKAEQQQEQRDMLADIQRQEAESWQKCAECGKFRRTHGKDHEFQVAA